MPTFTDAEKNLLVSALEKSLEDAQEGSGVTASLDEIETAIAALRTAYDTDPATCTAANIVAAIDMVLGCTFSSLSNHAAVITEARSEAA
jgi:hypothetical protein